MVVEIVVNFIELLKISKEGTGMNSKKIIKFPVDKKGYTGIRSSKYREFNLNQGYGEIQFSSKEIESNFNESIKLFSEFIENFEDPKYVSNVKKAIDLSKYNVDARVWEIVSKDCTEYETELRLIRLRDEAYNFEEGFVDGNLFPINYLYLRACHHLSEFYLGNKLYNKVRYAYKPFYFSLDMDNEVMMPMHHNFVVASLILNDFTEVNRCYKLANKHGKNEDEIILLSKVFYHLMQGEEKEAVAFFNKLIKVNKYISDVLDRITNPKLIKFSTDDDCKYLEALNTVMKFDYFLSKEYYFDFLMHVRESEYVIGDDLDKYADRKEITVADMKRDRSFMAIRDTELKIMHENFLLTKEDFLEITKAEFLKIKGLGKGTIRNLHMNGVMFADDSEFDIQMELMEDDLW